MVTPAQQDLARWIFRRERDSAAQQQQQPDAPIALTARVLGKLAPAITGLVTTTGYRALLARTLQLARSQSSALDAVRIPAAGSYIDGPEVPSGKAIDDGLVALAGNLIALLTTFIGEELTNNLIRDAWPEDTTQRNAPVPGVGGMR